jgi:hypothetical protein
MIIPAMTTQATATVATITGITTAMPRRRQISHGVAPDWRRC